MVFLSGCVSIPFCGDNICLEGVEDVDLGNGHCTTDCGSLSASYFAFTTPPYDDTFVIKLTDPVRIAQARQIIAGEKKWEVHVMGTIVKSRIPYNPRWNFHVDPDSVAFFGNAMDICDFSISDVESNLDNAGSTFLPNNVWCPAGSVLVGEVSGR